MILRRLATSFRKQDWFAVIIETLIVVMGVFIGLQVNNWNEKRNERGVEAQILERLRQEIPALTAMRDEDKQFAQLRKRGLETAVVKLYREGSTGELTDLECLSIALSHIYSIPPDNLPVIAELLATGRIDSIRDEDVRTALSRFVLARDRGRVTQAAVSAHINQLATSFPDLIASGYQFDDSEEVVGTRPVCNTDGIRASTAFLNMLISNNERFELYYWAVFEPVDTELEALLNLISDETS